MTKTFILDTNVFLHDPGAFRHFEDNTVIIPISVIEEIDHFKRDLSERGRCARQFSRMLDELRKRGKLSDGIDLENGGRLRVAMARSDSAPARKEGYADREILDLALHLRQQPGADPCVIVSKDINLRIKADGMGIDAEDYETDRVDLAELYLGYAEMEISAQDFAAFKADGELPFAGEARPRNEYFTLRDRDDPGHTALARLDPTGTSFVSLVPVPRELAAVRPRNREQFFALDALLDERIKLVTLIGKAGTGKTLLAVAAGLHNTLERKLYRKMLVSRPTLPLGRDLGYLPGTLQEKLDPWMQPVFDALDLLHTDAPRGERGAARNGVEALEAKGKISIEPLSFIRGRSIHQQFMIIDEAQNLTPLEVKTIITRAGHGSKIILTGDIYQIDNPYVDATSNGLAKVVGCFRPHGLAAHITLQKGVRSELAELAANVL